MKIYVYVKTRLLLCWKNQLFANVDKYLYFHTSIFLKCCKNTFGEKWHKGEDNLLISSCLWFMQKRHRGKPSFNNWTWSPVPSWVSRKDSTSPKAQLQRGWSTSHTFHGSCIRNLWSSVFKGIRPSFIWSVPRLLSLLGPSAWDWHVAVLRFRY